MTTTGKRQYSIVADNSSYILRFTLKPNNSYQLNAQFHQRTHSIPIIFETVIINYHLPSTYCIFAKNLLIKDMKDRLLSLDAIKGIAIILVLMEHIYIFSDDQITLTYSFVTEFILAVHMPLFILLAGFFAQKMPTQGGWIKYIRDKSIRLVIPALVWYGLWTIWHDGQFHLSGALTNQYWFTLNLFIYFAIFGLQNAIINYGLRVSKNEDNRVLEVGLHIGLMIIISYCLSNIIPNLHPKSGEILSIPRTRMACLYPYFVIGYALGRLKLISYLQTQISGAVSGLVLIGCIWVFTFYQMHEPYLEYGLLHIYRLMTLAFFAFLIFCVESVTATPNKIGKGLVFLGQWSLPIYFIHFYFIPRLSGLHNYLAQYTPQLRISTEFLLYLIGSLIILLPTLIVAYCIKQNIFLSRIFLGEKN